MDYHWSFKHLLIAIKVDQLRILSSEVKLDVIFISETFLRSDVDNALCSIPGFGQFCQDLPTHCSNKGGGLAVYYRDSLSLRLQPNNASASSRVETIWVQLNRKNARPILLGGVYRPPSTNAADLDAFRCQLGDLSGKEIIVVCDCNDKLHNSLNFMKDLSFVQLINEATRPQSNALLDHVFIYSNRPNHLHCSGVAH